MIFATPVRRMLRIFLRREPTADEARVFAALSADASSLGNLLRHTQRIKLDNGAPVNLTDGDEREMLLAGLRAGCKQHVRAGEDLLTLLERLNRMVEASTGKRDPERRTELAIVLLRALTICELLETEARERFPYHAPLDHLARDTARSLAQGYLRVLGRDVPADVKRAFPRFTRGLREADGQFAPTTPTLLQRLAGGRRAAADPVRERKAASAVPLDASSSTH
jgi:hypothetical protein